MLGEHLVTLKNGLRWSLSVACWGYTASLTAYLILRWINRESFWFLGLLGNFVPYYFLPLVLLTPLAYIQRNRWLFVSTSLLMGFGVLWFLPRYIPNNLGHPVIGADSTLKVVTFNVWGDNPRQTEAIAWLQKTDADIVMLQEIPPAWADDGIPQLREAYPYQVSQSLDLRVWGDAFLSRHPILARQSYDLENGFPANDRFEIEVHGELVAIYNVHLYMPQGSRLNFLPLGNHWAMNLLAQYDERGRNSQITSLLEIVGSETLPFIVAGDFNTSDNTMQYARMSRVWTDSFRQAGLGIGATWPNAEIVGFPSSVPCYV